MSENLTHADVVFHLQNKIEAQAHQLRAQDKGLRRLNRKITRLREEVRDAESCARQANDDARAARNSRNYWMERCGELQRALREAEAKIGAVA